MTYVRAVEGCGLDFFEQPVEAHDLAGMAAVAAATRFPSAPMRASIRSTTSGGTMSTKPRAASA